MSEFTLVKDEPTVYPVDATKATLEEMGVLFNALGIAMTVEYAEERGLAHLLDTSKSVKPAQ
jgi:cytochrome c biogenesis factor